MSKKVIISGVTGQDGSLMAKYLLKNTDFEILGAVRRTSQDIHSNIREELDNPRFKLVIMDLLDPNSITTLIKNEKPDFFINLAAQSFVADSWTQPVMTMEANSTSVIYMLEAIRQFCPSCRFYSAGSSEQWGDVSYSPQDEKHPMRPRSVYGVSKCAAGLIVKVYRESYGLYAVHGILTNHEGAFRQKHFVTRKITAGVARIYWAIKNNRPFKPIELGNLDAKRDWSDARDFVDGIWKMLNQDQPKEYVLSSNETHSIREFIELAFANAGIEGAWTGKGKDELFYSLHGLYADGVGKLVVINSEFYRPAEVDLLLGDSTLARTDLGWEPQISFEKLVEEMVANDILLAKTVN